MTDTPTTPYLIRAIYEWCCDNGETPYVAVRVDAQTRVPAEYVKDGEIVLNIGADATRNLKIDNDAIRFSARFSGVSREILIPVGSVKGVFSKESGQGLAFQLASQAGAPPPLDSDPTDKPPKPPGGRARLQVVK